jgi:hypothetical protein
MFCILDIAIKSPSLVYHVAYDLTFAILLTLARDRF